MTKSDKNENHELSSESEKESPVEKVDSDNKANSETETI